MPYTLKRILLTIPTILGVAVVIFFVLRVVPGDIVELKMRSEGAVVSQEMIDRERANLGLDRPLVVQFLDWGAGLLRGDLGNSLYSGRDVASEVFPRLALSVQIAVMATVVGILIAVPLGTISALYAGSWFDYGVRIFAMAGLAVPAFWLGMLLIMFMLNVFDWLPPLNNRPIWVDPWGNLQQLIWPALAVGYRFAAVLARMIRSSVLEVLREDYVRTARAKGMRERIVVVRHALRNAMLPPLTIVGLEFAFMLGGLVVTEQVFSLNGIGRLFIDSVQRLDFIMIQGIVVVLAVLFVIVNLAVDLLYGVIDPRVRYD